LLFPSPEPISEMKRIISSAVLAITALIIASGSAQTPASNDEQQLLSLIKDVQAQQGQIAENQDKIDTRLADVTETVRVARIFAGRGGR
jgi:outer membrane lipoprotein-sorting protein